MALTYGFSDGRRTRNKIPLSFHIMTLLARRPAFVTRMKKKVEQDVQKSLRGSVSNPDILARLPETCLRNLTMFEVSSRVLQNGD